MRDVVDQLMAHDGVVARAPASSGDIDAVSRALGAPVPHLLTKLWRQSGGLTLEQLDCHVPGPSAVLEMLGDGACFDLSHRGLLPILDDHQSNFLAVFVRGPRVSRVARLPHDDGSRLLYRDAGSCFRALIECANQGSTADSYFCDTKGDYSPDESRSEEDQEAAKALIAGPHDLDEWNHAVQLLDARNLPEWRRLLETDHFVRRDALERMREMSSGAIKKLLVEDQKAFDDFVSLAADAAWQAGLEVGGRERDVLQVGGKWMSMEAFFHRRKIPNAVPRMVAWFQDLIHERDPHNRAGHFMAD